MEYNPYIIHMLYIYIFPYSPVTPSKISFPEAMEVNPLPAGAA